MPNIYSRIRKRREEIGLSQEELAIRMGYKSKSSINKIEMGVNDIPQSKVFAFAKALGTTTAYLMGCEDPADSEAAAGDELTLTEKEKGVVKCYRRATDDDRTVVDAVLKKYQENPARAVRSAG